MRVGTLIFLSENFPVCSVFPIAKIAAFGSSYRSVVIRTSSVNIYPCRSCRRLGPRSDDLLILIQRLFNPRARRSPPSWIIATKTTSSTITVNMIWLSKR